MIYLRYSNDNFETYTGIALNELKIKTTPIRSTVKGSTLRGTAFSHKRFTKTNNFSLVVSADELYSTTKYNFMLNFFKAGAHRFSADDTTYIDIVLDDENFNEEYLEENRLLPEITFNFLQKYKD
jgi:hypothetical protein